MSHSHHHNPSTAGMHTYGLAGIELARATERRDAERQRDAIAGMRATAPGPLAGIRQALGEAMIRIGATIAGEAAKAPRVAPAPKVTTT